MSDSIVVTTGGNGVATIKLNRPDKHNAFDETIIAEFTHTLADLGSNPNIRIVILASEGPSFSAGADANWMKRMATYTWDENVRDANGLARLLNTLNFLPKPTIARVQGAAMGGGAGLVCCCDIVVAAENAKFAFSEVKLGLVPATISPYVIKAIGARAARQYFLSGARFSANQALDMGMVSQVVAEENLDTSIAIWIERLSTNSAHAMCLAKQLIVDVEAKPINEELIQFTSKIIASARCSDDAREGLNAFLEKRKPSWCI